MLLKEIEDCFDALFVEYFDLDRSVSEFRMLKRIYRLSNKNTVGKRRKSKVINA